jgi:hypothetical protein
MTAKAQPKAGWLARWRERRRRNATRAAEIHRRANDATRRDFDRASRYGGGGGGDRYGGGGGG